MEVNSLQLDMLIVVSLVDGLLLHLIMSSMLVVFLLKQITHIAVEVESAIPAQLLDIMKLFVDLQCHTAMQLLILVVKVLFQLLQQSNLGQLSALMKM